MQSIWEKSGDTQIFASIDQDASWNRFRQLSRQDKQKTSLVKLAWWQVAAAIFILIGGGWLGYTYWIDQQVVQIAALDQAIYHNLPDGSLVYLYPEARLKYNERYFKSSGRRVTFEGKGYFQVEKIASGKPFTIQALDNEVTVLGTAFVLDADAEREYTSLSLYEGSVMFTSGRDTITLEPGERILQNKAVLKKEQFQQDSTIPKLEDTPVTEIFEALSDKYLVEFYYEGEWPSCSLTGNLEAKTLDEVLAYLEFILGLKYSVHGQLIIVNQLTCNQ